MERRRSRSFCARARLRRHLFWAALPNGASPPRRAIGDGAGAARRSERLAGKSRPEDGPA